MHSSPKDTSPDSGSGASKSRLDRELEEILSRNENIRLLPPPPAPPKRKAVRPAVWHTPAMTFSPRARVLMTSPIVLALALAIAAMLVSGLSPLLANVLALVAVVCILLPMVQRFRRSPGAPPETRMWRGQVIDAPRPNPSSPLDAARDWWKSRQR